MDGLPVIPGTLFKGVLRAEDFFPHLGIPTVHPTIRVTNHGQQGILEDTQTVPAGRGQ